MIEKRPERRAYIRIEYPPKERPRFKVGEHEMEVINLSEKGLKFLDNKQAYGTSGKMIDGALIFLNGKLIKLRGQIVLNQGNEVGILINGRIAYPIMEEQRDLIKKNRP